MGEINTEVLRGLRNGEIIVYYQPKYHAVTNRMCGAEALARWKRPDGTIVEPDQFIPVLEKEYQVCELDWYMLEEVCKFLAKRMQELKHVVPISVNFSIQHIREMRVASRIAEIVDRYHIDHELIQFEITESAFVEAPEEMPLLVEAIHGRGFYVGLDDFGKGLSSLGFLAHIEIDALKIDKSLLAQNCETERERVVLEAIFDCAHRLDLVTIAEGVETKEQLAFMRTSGCNLIQGHCFDPAMPEEEFAKRIDQTLNRDVTEDILTVQSQAMARQLLLDAVFTGYPLIIFSNLTRNSFYMMNYENFTSQLCPSVGVYTELIEHGATTMHPEDRALFKNTFHRESQIAQYRAGAKSLSVITRQCGDDGIYRRVKTTNYFVKNPNVDDVLVISLCQNLD